MVKVLFDEDNILSLEAAANRLSEKYGWKSYTVDAKDGIIHAVSDGFLKFYIDLGGFAYEEGGNGADPIDSLEVNWATDLFGDCWKSVLFAKNEDGEYVIVHD